MQGVLRWFVLIKKYFKTGTKDDKMRQPFR